MELLIVTGMSGAGKTQALRSLEDMGYFCVDNLPFEMLKGFIELCAKTQPAVERSAVVIDSRESVFKYNSESALKVLDEIGVSYEILFLDCRDDVLERRYNETRRRHPMSDDVREGIDSERELLSPLRYRASHIIDTSKLKPLELNHILEDLLNGDKRTKFMLTVESFGYKRGVPIEADMVFDMRFSPNPFYEPELRKYSGADAPVREFVLSDGSFVQTINEIEVMLRRNIPRFIDQGKRRLFVAFGCTGGRHRSVCAAVELHERMKDTWPVKLIHRDTIIEADDIVDRTGDRDGR